MGLGVRLSTMEPNPAWDAVSYEEWVAVFAGVADEVTVRVWCGDWCPDCRSQLPDFAAAVAAAGIPGKRVEEYPVEKAADGSKVGPLVEEYGVEFIPTVVVEQDGREVARFVEEAPVPILVHLAEQLAEAGDSS